MSVLIALFRPANRALRSLAGLICLHAASLAFAGGAPPQPLAQYVNWEVPVIHPLDLSPDGSVLAVCNLPDETIDLYDVTGASPVAIGSVSVGLNPVSVRFRTNDEIWAVNHISDTVSVFSRSALRVLATLQTSDEPCDVVFAGPQGDAFVSCSQANSVERFDVLTRIKTGIFEVDGEDPRALSVSPDGSKIYVSIFESGNASTIIGGGAETLNVISFPPNDALFDPAGPYGGLNPPPNFGPSTYFPPINPALPIPPSVSLIVKRNAQGQWRDDNIGNWTEYISGSKAHMSGRVQGWNMPDHDLMIIDLSTGVISYVSGLMNLLMASAVNPATGEVTIVGTDALNQIRFEPNVNGRFLRVLLAKVNPSTLAKSVTDLNPHLGNYGDNQIPQGERNRSLGDPRGIAWNAAGTKAYVSGLGSNNLAVIDANGARTGPQQISLGEGPMGMVLDHARDRLYVLNRFEMSLSVVNTVADVEILRLPLHDSTPPAIRAGRKHLYDTHKTSGLGHIACASCHIDSRMDRLAWDLGDPSGVMKTVNSVEHNLGGNVPGLNTGYKDFHPMKGPMTTQTLQDIIGLEPLHWRGDRDGLEEFNPAFTGLQADDVQLTPTEMQQYEDFLATVTFPPNAFRLFDNTLSQNVPLPGHYSTGRFAGFGGLQAGQPLPNGNAVIGLDLYTDHDRGIDRGALACVTCHVLPTGGGTHLRFDGSQFQPIPPGPLGESKTALMSVDGTTNRSIKVAQLRNQFDKVGFETTRTTSRAGFGFLHDGSVDSLSRFLSLQAFNVSNDFEVAHLVALVLSFSGSNLPAGNIFDPRQPPGPPSKDTHAAVGRQVTITSSAPVSLFGQADVIQSMINLANQGSGRVDLIVKGFYDGTIRGFFFDRATDQFLADRNGETVDPAVLRASAAPNRQLTYTLVPRNLGRRLGIDRDLDGFWDRLEIDGGSDPADHTSFPSNRAENWGLYQ